ncbi:MAG: DinB family protein [Bryobacteraceae bacterium]
MSPQLLNLVGQLDAASERAKKLVEGLPEEALLRRPWPDRWSIAENLQHLDLTSKAYFPILDEAAARGLREADYGNRPFRLDFWGFALKWYLEPPSRMKAKTTKPFEPPNSAGALEAFLRSQAQIGQRFESLKGLAIDKIKIRSPFAEQVRYSVWSALNLIVAHERRHLWQAEQAKLHLD